MITIEQYIEHYNDQDYINKIAILILDIDNIINGNYEDEVLPYLWVNDMPKMEDWITDWYMESFKEINSLSSISPNIISAVLLTPPAITQVPIKLKISTI